MRIDVGAGVDCQRIAENLLRAHICKRAEDLASNGLLRHLRIGVRGAGKPEVENFWLSVFIHQNISGLEVAMDDAALMGMLYRLAHLDHQFETLADVEFVLFRVFDEGFTVDEFHGKEGLYAETRFRTTGLINLSDSGVMQPR